MSASSVALGILERRRRERCFVAAHAIYWAVMTNKKTNFFYFSLIAVRLLYGVGEARREAGQLKLTECEPIKPERAFQILDGMHRAFIKKITKGGLKKIADLISMYENDELELTICGYFTLESNIVNILNTFFGIGEMFTHECVRDFRAQLSTLAPLDSSS